MLQILIHYAREWKVPSKQPFAQLKTSTYAKNNLQNICTSPAQNIISRLDTRWPRISTPSLCILLQDLIKSTWLLEPSNSISENKSVSRKPLENAYLKYVKNALASIHCIALHTHEHTHTHNNPIFNSCITCCYFTNLAPSE